ncbi:hypothetical protein [Kitasatospora sp. A2-31]|uniref:hypothetical protein n=1 Tax=Kitasatospora sp. A2-31 TaxID=2916414 RepID=UPI001EEC1D86|nr:hypothetical protein [Kitasatospora sp. A2-31]MCG6494474.1 hypothetical protein [Kitasatospora sp. A2-31]
MSATSRQLPLPTGLPLIGLYPAAYRAAHGEEIAAVFAESVEGAGRGTVLREWAVLAAHALRLRTGLSSRDRLGRVAAGAAPLMLAGGAALATVHLLLGLVLRQPFFADFAHPGVAIAVGAAQTLPWILALSFAVAGHWPQARLLVLAGTLLRIGSAAAALLVGYASFWQYVFLLPFWLVLGGVLLAAPPDAVDLSRRGRYGMALVAGAVALPMITLVTLWPWPEPGLSVEAEFSGSVKVLLDVSTAWPATVMCLVYLVRLGAARPDRLRAAGAAVAALPWTVMLSAPDYLIPPVPHAALRNLGVVVGLIGVCTAIDALRRAVAVRTGRTGGADRAAGVVERV